MQNKAGEYDGTEAAGGYLKVDLNPGGGGGRGGGRGDRGGGRFGGGRGGGRGFGGRDGGRGGGRGTLCLLSPPPLPPVIARVISPKVFCCNGVVVWLCCEEARQWFNLKSVVLFGHSQDLGYVKSSGDVATSHSVCLCWRGVLVG